MQKATTPALRPFVQLYAAGSIVDLVGFWTVWHLEGGFEGLRAMGMRRALIYRRVKFFRIAFGAHPEEFVMPGITLDIAAHREGWEKVKAEKAAAKAAPQSRNPETRSHRLGIVRDVRPREPFWALSLYPDSRGGRRLCVGCTAALAVGRGAG